MGEPSRPSLGRFGDEQSPTRVPPGEPIGGDGARLVMFTYWGGHKGLWAMEEAWAAQPQEIRDEYEGWAMVAPYGWIEARGRSGTAALRSRPQDPDVPAAGVRDV